METTGLALFKIIRKETTGLDLIKVWLGQALASGAHPRRI